MDRLRRLNQIWSWLPAFRAVAESEHLPTAAKALRVTAPALSRAIRLIEGSMEVPLFRRERRRLVLNEAGRALLDAVRDAMRLIDDGWDRAISDELRGPIRIGIEAGAASPLLARVAGDLSEQYPALVPEISVLPAMTIASGLRDGTIDLALIEQMEAPSSAFTIENLGTIRYHLYVGKKHPFARQSPSEAQILAASFVGPAPPATDGWPRERNRKVGIIAGSLALAIEICADGKFVAAFPEAVEYTASAALRRVPSPIRLSDSILYAVYRPVLTSPTRVEITLAAIRRRMRSIRRRTRGTRSS